MTRTALAVWLMAGIGWSAAALAHEPGELGTPPLPLMSPAAAGTATDEIGRPRQAAGQTLPLTPARTLAFTVHSGTWMSLDLSPDGKTIVFDLLGDLYRMPAGGGLATRLSQGLAFDTQPTFAPDGRSIAFVSDRSGADNLWIARADGSGARQISFGDDDTVLASPAWSADGRSVYISRYRPSLNHYELWRYDLDGRTALIVPVRDTPAAPRDSWRSSLGAVASPDGKSLYLARRTGSLDFAEVDSWTIVRRDLASGAESEIAGETDPRRSSARGSYFRPALSADGRLLAYAARLRNQTELRVRDLQTGEDRRVAFPIEHDQLQASMWQDIVPRYAFTRDGKALILSRNGGIERIDLARGTATALPFSADVQLALGASTRVDIREETGPVRARLVQAPVASPDGRTIAFSALARLYTATREGDTAPTPLDTLGKPAFQPSWSLDGTQLVYVSWSEAEGGAVWTMPADGSAAPRRRSDVPAYYSYPVFAAEGDAIIAVRSPQQARLASSFEYGKLRDAELVAIALAGGPVRVLARGTMASRPQFTTSRPGEVLILTDDGLTAIDMRSGAKARVALVKGPGWYFQDGAVPVDDVRISPDGKWLVAQVAQQLHLVAVPASGDRVVDLSDPNRPHRRLTDEGADYFEWSADGRTIDWAVGSTFQSRALATIPLNPADRPSWRPLPQSELAGRALKVTLPRAQATGSILLRGARLLTMADGDRVFEAGDLLVVDGRIVAVGPSGSIAAPAGAMLVDVTGKTILPGFIDTHDHIGGIKRDVLGLSDWGLQARLAYGVTTSFDPSTLSIDMLAYQDLLDAGLMVGPRLRSTGPALFSMNRFESPEDVRAVLRRYRDHYRVANIKQYRSGNRRVRQWIADAAHEMKLQPTSEGALAMKLDLTQILDGYGAHEHALPAALGEDVVRLMAETRTGYTTTLSITNGGAPAQDWFVVQHGAQDAARLRRFWPQGFIDAKFTARPWQRLEEYRFPAIAADAGKVQRAGGVVGMGSHGEMPGIGFHYEMEAHVAGGMTPMMVLHAATIGAAEVIGRAAELGSMVPGKYADLVILDRDPRGDITAARAIAQIMSAGRLYDGATLDQLWPVKAPLVRYWKPGDAPAVQWLPEARR